MPAKQDPVFPATCLEGTLWIAGDVAKHCLIRLIGFGRRVGLLLRQHIWKAIRALEALQLLKPQLISVLPWEHASTGAREHATSTLLLPSIQASDMQDTMSPSMRGALARRCWSSSSLLAQSAVSHTHACSGVAEPKSAAVRCKMSRCSPGLEQRVALRADRIAVRAGFLLGSLQAADPAGDLKSEQSEHAAARVLTQQSSQARG